MIWPCVRQVDTLEMVSRVFGNSRKIKTVFQFTSNVISNFLVLLTLYVMVGFYKTSIDFEYGLKSAATGFS